jgi:hypothetical protein
MPSHNILAALDTYAYIYQRFETIPFNWNTKTHKLYFVSGWRQLSIWILNISSMVVFGVGGCIYLFSKEIFSENPSIPVANYPLIFGFTTIGIFILVVAIAAVVYGEEFVLAWNANRLPKELMEKVFPKPAVDYPGIVLLYLAKTFAVHPTFLFFVGGLYLKVDTFYLIMKQTPWIWNNWICFLPAAAFRIIMMAMLLIEAPRLILLILILLISGIRKALESLDIMMIASERKMHHPFQSFFLIRCYIRLQIHSLLLKFQEVVTFFLMALGLILAMFSGAGTVRGYSVVPFMFYIVVCPVLFVCTVGIIQMTVPKAVEIHEKSVRLQKQWASCCVARKHYMSKKLQSLQSIKVFAGIGDIKMFYFEKSTRLIFYSTIISNTVNILLLFKDTKLEVFV